MATLNTTDGTEIFYKDWGSGQPIVFSHGWPLSADAWDAQMLFFGQLGCGRQRRLPIQFLATGHDRRCKGTVRLYPGILGG